MATAETLAMVVSSRHPPVQAVGVVRGVVRAAAAAVAVEEGRGVRGESSRQQAREAAVRAELLASREVQVERRVERRVEEVGQMGAMVRLAVVENTQQWALEAKVAAAAVLAAVLKAARMAGGWEVEAGVAAVANSRQVGQEATVVGAVAVPVAAAAA